MERSLYQEYQVQNINFLELGVSDKNAKKSQSGHIMSICSFNILADLYVKPPHKSDPSYPYYDFKYRAPRVVETLRKLNADIVILQEVDHVEDYYQKEWVNLGYNYAFKTKTDGDNQGVAILYKTKIFNLKEKIDFEFDRSHPFMKYDIYKQGNIGICLDLYHIASKKNVAVMGVHLYWDPKLEEVKFLQTCMILNFLERRYKKDDIVFWGGDLNSKPEDNNISYIFSRAEPQYEAIDNEQISTLKHEKSIFNKYMSNNNNPIDFVNLYSRYGEARGVSKMFPDYTNFKQKFKAVLDHIFYNSATAFPVQILEIDEKGTSEYLDLPNKEFPSDHLPIMGVFII